jgi:hypothetical protein
MKAQAEGYGDGQDHSELACTREIHAACPLKL